MTEDEPDKMVETILTGAVVAASTGIQIQSLEDFYEIAHGLSMTDSDHVYIYEISTTNTEKTKFLRNNYEEIEEMIDGNIIYHRPTDTIGEIQDNLGIDPMDYNNPTLAISYENPYNSPEDSKYLCFELGRLDNTTDLQNELQDIFSLLNDEEFKRLSLKKRKDRAIHLLDKYTNKASDVVTIAAPFA